MVPTEMRSFISTMITLEIRSRPKANVDANRTSSEGYLLFSGSLIVFSPMRVFRCKMVSGVIGFLQRFSGWPQVVDLADLYVKLMLLVFKR